MDRFADYIIRHKTTVIIIFALASVSGIILQFFVGVNYNMADYLPEEAQSTKALEIMENEFDSNMPNANVMVEDVSIQEAVQYKSSLSEIDGISEVLWLDDVIDIKAPLEIQDRDTVESYYKDGSALFTITVEDNMEREVFRQVWELIGEDNAYGGDAANTAEMQELTGAEVTKAMVILMPIVLLILVLSTTAWVEPLLYITALGVSILINMGTNIFLGEISFMTNSVSPILQMAVSLDYAIFMLHSFRANRKIYGDEKTAMKHAIKESITAISASAATTLFGFLALMFMDFRIGADLGLNLAKGIVITFVTIIVFLPALTLFTYKWLDKTAHRELLPDFKNINKYFSKLGIPALIIVALLIVPAYLGQNNTVFEYGSENPDGSSITNMANQAIEEKFGKATIMVLLVPEGNVATELELSQELMTLDHVTGVMSFANTVGTALPSDFLDPEITSQFYSENYARIVIYTDTESEGDIAFQTVENIMNVGQSYYDEKVYSAGESANVYDMSKVVEKDNTVVTIVAVIAIFLTLLVTFKSAVLPFILLLTIEVGIWINLSIPYFTGGSMNFIGFLVLNTVQLGATVDYAILLTDTYLGKRKMLTQKPAMNQSMASSFSSILVSGMTLATAGFALFFTSTNPAVQDIGLLLGRGTLISMSMVLFFLPAMLRIFDGPIGKTTYKAEFAKTDSDSI